MLNFYITIISSEHPLVLVNLAIKFSYNFIAATLNSKVALLSFSLSQRLVLGTMSNGFLKSTTQHRRLVLTFI